MKAGANESPDTLGVGKRLLVEYGMAGCEAVIVGEGNGRFAVKLLGEVLIMDREELERRKYIVMPAKKPSWLQRLFAGFKAQEVQR